MLMKKEVIEDNEKLKEKNEQLKLERDTAIEVAKVRKQTIEDIQRKLDIEKLEKLKLEQELREEKQAYNKIYNRNQKAIEYIGNNTIIEYRKVIEMLKGEDKE